MINEPTPPSVQPDINEAFEALRREVSLTRHAVEGLVSNFVGQVSLRLVQSIDRDWAPVDLERGPVDLDAEKILHRLQFLAQTRPARGLLLLLERRSITCRVVVA